MAPIALYDADCGFCSSFISFVRSRLRAKIDAVPFQQAELSGFNLTLEECIERLQVVDGEDVLSGGAAVARILRASKFPWPIVGRGLSIIGVRWIVDQVYSVVARHRHQLPGGTAACELPDPLSQPGPGSSATM